jgi:sugar phosphate isomerase/epimerase
MTQSDIKLGTTLYAFTNEFHQRKYDFDGLVREVGKRNLGPGLEIVGFQSLRGFPHVSDDTASHFKNLIAETGLTPTCLGINSDMYIRKDYTLSHRESVDYHARQIKSAATLGFPVARYQYGAGPEVIRELAPLATDLNVKLALEIHAPHTINHPEVMAYREMYARVNSPYLGFIPDFGASARKIPPVYLEYFRSRRHVPEKVIQHAVQMWNEDSDPFTKRPRFLEWAKTVGLQDSLAAEVPIVFTLFGRQSPRAWLDIMPQVIHVHGKFFGIDENGEDPSIDYKEHVRVFKAGGYRGYFSSEWEGHQVSDDDGFEKVIAYHAMMTRLVASS